jgi:hypothetical protein
VRGRSLLGGCLVLGLLPLSAQHRPAVTVSGLGYLSYRYFLDGDPAQQGAHANNFDVDRAYLTVTGQFDHGLSTRVTADIDPGRSTSSALSFRLKYAYLAWRPAHTPFTLKAGAIQTPLIDWLEELWGYRMQGTVALDRVGALVSSDLGLSVAGRSPDDRLDAVVGVYNGEGYSGRPGDAGKDLAARVSFRVTGSGDRTDGLRVTGYAQVGKATGGGHRRRLVGVVSWQGPRFTVAGEYAITRDSLAPARPAVAGQLSSVYAVYHLPPTVAPLTLLGRIDRFDPDRDRDPPGPDLASGVQTRVIVGIGARLAPQLRVLLDLDLLSLAHGSPDDTWNATRRALQLQSEFTF